MSHKKDEPSLGPEHVSRINQVLLGSDVGETLRQDIVQLQIHVECIRQLFDKVLYPLEDFDDRYLPSDPTRYLAPEWHRFSERFNEYVDKSRESAAAASSTMHLYAEAVLGKVGEVNCDVQALETELKLFQRAVEQHIPAAQHTRNSFKQLANDIKDFERKVERTLKQLNRPVPQDMHRTCDDIDVLKQKVANISDGTSELGSSYLQSMASFAPRAAGILCTLSPRAAIQALRSVFVISPTEVDTQKQEAQTCLAQCAAQLPALLESAHIPSEVRPFYEDWWANTREDIRMVASRIEAITRIWDHLRVDLLTLEAHLSLCASGDSVANSPFLMGKIDVSRAVLGRLTECLQLYVHHVPPNERVLGAV